ncbi:MAG: bifunctional 4-hydroxy-2-oxoglutarate aldolase/2-dehydro-3-deoxy-phosphogluconate aldolase [Betaproteobacteria bacterium]|jgi:2-dehydro-3-deoxyphosphogluconate aldolase/(4S)-4-hydroxy-2-oxoglutarate aldolase|nr:bifunctional 4-hydroxy-2-oxoglutarate aldolase/2-dehydro-3-deoxy-phosphogluconate aldolase [Betaproteobacteria bacterium]
MHTIASFLIEQRIIPVLRLKSRALAERGIAALAEAGFGSVEITLTTPDALALIRAQRTTAAPGLLVGAGTVLDLDSARACLDAGAQFLVSPCVVPGMGELAHAAGAACLAGAFTPGEVLAAWRSGADVVKVFPASTGGPAHLAALHAVFPHIPLCPTGGVNLDSLEDWRRAGAAVVGVGNHILDIAALEAGDLARVIAHAARFLGRQQA